jgi:hypothetical protein
MSNGAALASFPPQERGNASIEHARIQQIGSKLASGPGVKQGHFHPGFRGSLHGKDVALVRESGRQCNHND